MLSSGLNTDLITYLSFRYNGFLTGVNVPEEGESVAGTIWLQAGNVIFEMLSRVRSFPQIKKSSTTFCIDLVWRYLKTNMFLKVALDHPAACCFLLTGS